MRPEASGADATGTHGNGHFEGDVSVATGMFEYPPASPDGTPLFRWKEVNCFMRPQSLMCERVADQHGLLFLFLESLYRTWGVDGYFFEKHKAHFQFAADVLPAAAGVTFRVNRIAEAGAALARLRELLGTGPVLVPANLQGSPLARRPDEDTVHYFIVTGADGSGCRILDSLHNVEEDSVPVYGPSSLSLRQLDTLMQGYWRGYVTGRLPTHHREEQYWLLQVFPAKGFDANRSRVRQQVLRIYLDTFASDGTRSSPASFFDTRNLSAVRQALEATGAVPVSLIRGYLAEANACNVHLRVLEHAATGPREVDAADLSRSIERYAEHSTALRTNAMVRCLTGTTPEPVYWIDVGDRLWSSAISLRAEIIEHLGRLGLR